MSDSFKNAEGASLPSSIGEIPKKLKEYYDTLQGEAIPDRLLDLLEQLDQAEQAQKAAMQPSVEELK